MERIKIEPKEFWDDKKWAEKNYHDLQEKYPDKWVAIVDKKVVAAGKSLKQSIRPVRQRLESLSFS